MVDQYDDDTINIPILNFTFYSLVCDFLHVISPNIVITIKWILWPVYLIGIVGSSTAGGDDSLSGQTEVYNSAEDRELNSPSKSPPATAPKPRPKPSVPTPADYPSKFLKPL